MRTVGLVIALVGVLSIIFYFIGYHSRILMWIDHWGPTTGWVIRIGLVVVGAILSSVSSRR